VRVANRKLLVVIEKLYPAFVVREAPLAAMTGAVSLAVITALRLATEKRPHG